MDIKLDKNKLFGFRQYSNDSSETPSEELFSKIGADVGEFILNDSNDVIFDDVFSDDVFSDDLTSEL